MFKKFFLLSLFFSFQHCAATQPNTIIAMVTGFSDAYVIAITSNGLYAYVTDSPNVRVIDTNPLSPSFNTLISAPGLESVVNNPVALAAVPNGLFVYVADTGSNSVLIIDTDPLSPLFNTLIAAPSLNGTFNEPSGVVITPDGLRAYIINAGDNSVKVIDIDPASPTYNTILSTPGLDSILINPFSIAATPSGLYIYVSNLNGTMSVIDSDPASSTYNTLLAAPGLSSVNAQPEGFAITANSLAAYVSDGAGTDVTFLNINPASPSFNTVGTAPNLLTAFNAPNDVATTADGNYAYVTNFLGANGNVSAVSVIDTNPLNPTYNSTLLTPGLNPPQSTVRFFTLAVTPNAQYVYAVDGYNQVVDVIYTGIIDAPTNFTACKTENVFLSQTDFINHLTWSAPTFGLTPVSYYIFRDVTMQQLVAIVAATGPLQYDDHNRAPNVAYTYYIVSVVSPDVISSPAIATATAACV